MSKTKKLLFIMMFFMVVIACLMPNLNSGDGSDPYKHVAASSTAEPSVEDVTVVMPENYKVGNTSNFVNEDTSVDNKISDIIDSMTVEEKVAQLFFIKNDSRFDASVLEEYPVGGIILFSSDFAGETQDSLKEKLDSFQTNSDIPLLLGVDEEGGDVVRVSNYSALASDRFLSPRDLYNQGGYDAVLNDTIHKSELLLSYGINVNFAPVCDVSLEPTDYMYSRSFGVSAEATADYIDIVVGAMEEENMGSVLKHFPGYGSNGDTHTDVIRDTRSYEEFVQNDFLPFKAGIEQGADCVLVSHNIVECMDSEWPASLSSKVIDTLREELGFEGVVITDDLMMGGVSNYVSEEESAVRAIIAGNDMILSTNYQLQYQSVLDAVLDGTISEERIDESVRRILLWKYELGLIK
ncbi:MAG: beta-hexosaminidase [Lachnospiraceae bacterium]|nr:beta-hexosaminidase [Lachnospiraceae bacterium]